MIKKTKSPVALRRKKMKNGGESLYLDIYRNGCRKYEYLKLYLTAGKTAEEKLKDKHTLEIAETIRAKREKELADVVCASSTASVSVFTFADVHDKNNINYAKTLKILREINPDMRVFDLVDRKIILEFIDKLNQSGIRDSSKAIHYSKLKALANKAAELGLVSKIMFPKPNWHTQSRARSFLTIDEIKKLSDVETSGTGAEVKRAFLFSCLTGLRYSDIKKLDWKEISTVNGYTRITFMQKKTRSVEYLDINPQAADLLGARGSGLVFRLPTHVAVWRHLSHLVEKAGIDKHISFHCARHSFAVMMLSVGADLYTTSRLLGHTNVSTTQIYAKILDENKRKAVDLIPSVL